MRKTTRRQFLKQTTVAVAGLAALRLGSGSSAAATSAGAIPPHQPLAVHGVHAYPGEHSIAAGDTLELHVSNTAAYRLSICRLGHQVDDPAGDEVLQEFPEAPANPQPIHPGSYVHIAKGLSKSLPALTLECWVRPWRVAGFSGLISQYDYKDACGIGLFMNPYGTVGFYLGDGHGYRAEWSHASPKNTLKPGKWHHLAATWDGETKALWVNGKPVGSWPFAGPVSAGKAPLRLAAYGENGLAAKFLDGDLAMPVIHDCALSAEEIQARFEQQGLQPAKGKSVLACWPLAEEKGERVADTSGTGRHGRIINHGTWMIGGPSFDADVPRFGNYDPKTDPRRGHGLRFAADDLYDCRWPVTHRHRIPREAKSGIYVARMHFEFEGQPRAYHATFIVRKPARRKKAPILVVCAANTWRAYSATSFAITPPEQKQVWGTRGIKNAPGNPPMFALYGPHVGGPGTYQVGLRMPWPAAGPYILYGGPTNYSHLMRAERFAHVWLEQSGYDFDVISDVDLHRDPGVLRGYRAFVINGHNEYWSLPMYHGLERYLKGGGNVIVLSGNTLFWRVSFNNDCTMMECRKVDAPGNQVPSGGRGEAWHSQDGLRGGMMRECGWPGWQLIALDTLGWNNPGNPENFGPYVVDDPDHFLFNQPEQLGLKKGDKFGWTGVEGKTPMANGHEFDLRPSTLKALHEEPDPPGAAVPPDPPNIVRIANGILPWGKGGSAFDYFFRKIKPKTDQGGEMIWWERPDGGCVFNAGAIASGWVLSVDPKMQGLVRNVLAKFGVERR